MSLPEKWVTVVILIGWLLKHSHKYTKLWDIQVGLLFGIERTACPCSNLKMPYSTTIINYWNLLNYPRHTILCC